MNIRTTETFTVGAGGTNTVSLPRENQRFLRRVALIPKSHLGGWHGILYLEPGSAIAAGSMPLAAFGAYSTTVNFVDEMQIVGDNLKMYVANAEGSAIDFMIVCSYSNTMKGKYVVR